jgi:triosephosphate isomerase
MRQKLAAGNWKMNGTQAALGTLATIAAAQTRCEVLICPPAQLLLPAVSTAGGRIAIGAQDCHADAQGAHTGDLSADMIADTGAQYVILGHSERRQNHGETDAEVAAKARAAHQAGLRPILCIGETLTEYDAGQTLAVITKQLAGSVPDTLPCSDLVIAYEPVWAIGTGKIPDLGEIGTVHTAIRSALHQRMGQDAEKIRLLYGGSVKPANAAAIFACPDVDGALVGGASLSAADFLPITQALSAA